MAREERSVTWGHIIVKNGEYRFSLVNPIHSIQAEWAAEGVVPAGRLTFTVDGDAGSGGNVIDLGTGRRALTANTKLAFIDLAVAGLPAGGKCVLHFR